MTAKSSSWKKIPCFVYEMLCKLFWRKDTGIKKKSVAFALILFMSFWAVYYYNFSSIAYLKLGDKYYSGNGVMQDQDLALKWYLLAAERGNSDAQYSLGVFYFRQGEAQRGAWWYNKAAENGHIQAQNMVESLLKSNFKFASEASIGCEKRPKLFECIRRDSSAAFKRYVVKDIENTFFENQKKFKEKTRNLNFPKIGMIKIGDTYQDFALSMINAEYDCESFFYIGRSFEDLSEYEQSIFLGSFYKNPVIDSHTSLIKDSCKNAGGEVITVSFTMMGTIYMIHSPLYESVYKTVIPQLGYSQSEVEQAKEREHFGLPSFAPINTSSKFIEKGDYLWQTTSETKGRVQRIFIENKKYKDLAEQYFKDSYIADTYEDLGEE
jgi:TPR repeat protein